MKKVLIIVIFAILATFLSFFFVRLDYICCVPYEGFGGCSVHSILGWPLLYFLADELRNNSDCISSSWYYIGFIVDFLFYFILFFLIWTILKSIIKRK